MADSAITSAKNITSTRKVVEAGDIGKVHIPAENTHFLENKAKQMFSKAEDVGGATTKVTSELKFENVGEYFNHINDIGKRTDLTAEQKLERIHEAYRALGDAKGDVTVVADKKYLTSEAFGSNGRPLVDWPEKMGFAEDSIQAISRKNPLPEQWDRIGGIGGENFTTLPDNAVPFTYNERAIPYLENPSARHVGTFDNNSYFDAIDAIKGDNLEDLNKIATANGKKPVSSADFLDMKADYNDFQKRIEDMIGNIDSTYGLKGSAAPWKNSMTGEKLMDGGAEQIVTPIIAEKLEMIGVIPKY